MGGGAGLPLWSHPHGRARGPPLSKGRRGCGGHRSWAWSVLLPLLHTLDLLWQGVCVETAGPSARTWEQRGGGRVPRLVLHLEPSQGCE